MNRQQTYKGSSYYVGWTRGTLVYDNSLSLGMRAALHMDQEHEPRAMNMKNLRALENRPMAKDTGK